MLAIKHYINDGTDVGKRRRLQALTLTHAQRSPERSICCLGCLGFIRGPHCCLRRRLLGLCNIQALVAEVVAARRD